MDTILDMKTYFLPSVFFSLLPTDVAWDNIFICSCWVIALAYYFGKLRRSPTIMGGEKLWSGTMDNALLHVSEHSLADEIEEWITFALSYVFLYLVESDGEKDDNSAAANTFYISCGGGVSISSLLAITVSVSTTSNLFRFWIFTSYLFIPTYSLPSDDIVDWDNDSILVIEGGDTNID